MLQYHIQPLGDCVPLLAPVVSAIDADFLVGDAHKFSPVLYILQLAQFYQSTCINVIESKHNA